MRARLVAAVLLAALVGCTGPSPKSEGLRLIQVRFSDLPQWNAGEAALTSFQRSCAIVTARPDSEPMGGAGYAGTVADWRAVCGAASGEARDFFARNFTPFAVSGGEALFTGYYEPEIRGSRSRHDSYQTPVYGLPADLIRADLSLFNPKFKGEHISGRLDGRRLVPYADRAQINAKGVPAAPVLFFTDDPIAFFFLQIQGSGRVVFDDGSSTRIGYSGENGQPYTAIGRTLIAEEALTRENVSLQTIRAWLNAHPERAQSVMETNRSYIFFSESALEKDATGGTAQGPKGNLGANLTPLASVAVDPRLHALGAPLYVAAEGADPVHGVMVAQDIGGAIRGPVRADIFFGFGPEAERRAGAMKASGALYVLLPNALAAKIGKTHDYPL